MAARFDTLWESVGGRRTRLKEHRGTDEVEESSQGANKNKKWKKPVGRSSRERLVSCQGQAFASEGTLSLTNQEHGILRTKRAKQGKNWGQTKCSKEGFPFTTGEILLEKRPQKVAAREKNHIGRPRKVIQGWGWWESGEGGTL